MIYPIYHCVISKFNTIPLCRSFMQHQSLWHTNYFISPIRKGPFLLTCLAVCEQARLQSSTLPTLLSAFIFHNNIWCGTLSLCRLAQCVPSCCIWSIELNLNVHLIWTVVLTTSMWFPGFCVNLSQWRRCFLCPTDWLRYTTYIHICTLHRTQLPLVLLCLFHSNNNPMHYIKCDI